MSESDAYCLMRQHEEIDKLQARVAELEKALAAADYYIDRLQLCQAGKPVRDLGEAQSGYRTSRISISTLAKGRTG